MRERFEPPSHRVTFGPRHGAAPELRRPEPRSELRCSTRSSEQPPRPQSVPLLSFRRGLGTFPQRCGVRRPAHPITSKRQ